MVIQSTSPCPCCSGKSFKDCCEPFISGKHSPATPEQLMRSRFTAYALQDSNYLLITWHISTRPVQLDLKNETSEWRGLNVISAEDNRVNFVAYFTHAGKPFALTEESTFAQEPVWQYVSGTNVETIQLTKNMSCPCNSGKKFKRCCMPAFY